MSAPRLSLVSDRDPVDSVLVYVDDVVKLLGGRKSAWWVRNHFAPEKKLKVGRTVAWFRRDVEDFLLRLRVPR